jgi:S1-C subfamily serine protease
MVPSGHGIVIASVDEGTFASELGLIDNDIVESINRTPVNSVEDINRVRAGLKPGDAVAFHVYRPRQLNLRGKSRNLTQSAVSIYLAGTVPE